MPLEGAFASPPLWHNLALQPMLASMNLYEHEVEVDLFDVIATLPGSGPQHWHRDIYSVFDHDVDVFNGSPQHVTPPYRCAIFRKLFISNI